MSEHRHYSGPDLAPLLRQVRDDLGSDAEIIRAERIRSGGLAGFFAREHYEVVAKKVDLVAPDPAPRSVPQRVEPATATTPTADELIPSTVRPEVVEPATLPASVSDLAPSVPDEQVTANGSGRSIQAALLDRADRVSTEELLVRVAETHSPEWNSESFKSILGRAMVDWASPPIDGEPPPTAARADDGPIELETVTNREPVDGLRLSPVQPGENIVEPLPPAVPAAESGPAGVERSPVPPEGAVQTVPPEGAVPTMPTAPQAGESGTSHPTGPGPAPWADGAVPPSWGPAWMQGWPPWMIHGWPGYRPGDPLPAPAAHLCPNCADPVRSPELEGPGEPGGLDDPVPGGAPDAGSPPPEEISSDDSGDPVPTGDPATWTELRQEIDDVRLRIDDIIGTLRHVTADHHCDCGQAPSH